MQKYRLITLIILSSLFLGVINTFAENAPGGPGDDPIWNYAGKSGIGTSYEKYNKGEYNDNGQTGTISKVWFSIANGIITETAYSRIDKAQIKDLQFLIVGNDFFNEEKVDTNSKIEYLYTDSDGRPLSLAYKVVNTAKNNKYKIEKHIFTDPDRQTLFIRVTFTAYENNITPYIFINPHINNTGFGDYASVTNDSLNANEGNTYLCLKSSAYFSKTSAGFFRRSDGWTDLHEDHVMNWKYDTANNEGGGNVAMTAQLDTVNSQTKTFDIVVGFGNSEYQAIQAAEGSLNEGYDSLLKKYNGEGSAIGWEDYLSSLSNLPSMIPYTGDNGKELYVSAMVLKAQEDKQFAGALIASLSIPWGDTVSAINSKTGYRAIWPRDLYQCASALLALGDKETPLVSFKYLKNIQVTSSTPDNTGATGWFLQKTHVDGKREWIKVQMDQTAMPIMLGWKLWKAGILSNEEIKNDWYSKMLKPAAEFLANGGCVNIKDESSGCWNSYQVYPPKTQLERWEEQEGYSPSTIAAIITGLIAASDIAKNAAGDPGAASWYEKKADSFASKIEEYTFTTKGEYYKYRSSNDGEYYLRITKNENPNDHEEINLGNGRKPNQAEDKILDAGFLELVRYGVRAANDYFITDSLPELDDMTLNDDFRVKYEFTFDGKNYPGWRRYSYDGYGERANGSNWVDSNQPDDQRGRVWPFLTGERGHYELARIKADNGGTITDAEISGIRDTYVKAMEYFANEGLMIPEQVWDGVGHNSQNFIKGEGTNSATPLAWSHAEYVKLVRSLADKNIWDSYPPVIERYIYQKAYPQVYLKGIINNWGTIDQDEKDIPNNRKIWPIEGSGENTITFNDSANEYTSLKVTSLKVAPSSRLQSLILPFDFAGYCRIKAAKP
ncbi:MAG: glucan 1,4-alpha-glucosidase [bacterium]|nr:glucan 1,4-alpha-glucosidase [bacterium]